MAGKKVTVVVDSGAAENVMPRSMFPEDRNQADREVQEWKRIQTTRGRAHQELRVVGYVRQDP